MMEVINYDCLGVKCEVDNFKSVPRDNKVKYTYKNTVP
jgi:hypothetical protein